MAIVEIGHGVARRNPLNRQLTRVGTLAMLLAAASTDLTAQAGVVRGRVVRADASVGVADAELLLRPSGATTRSDPEGHFVFDGVAPGRVEITARRPGFLLARVMLRMDTLDASEVVIALEPVAAVLDPITAWSIRDPRSVGSVAGAVSVTDSSAIQRDRMVGLQEPLRMMPGVQVTSRYGTHDVNIGIRGSAAQTTQAVRGVAVLLDGVPLTQPEGRTRVEIIEVATARQIEVVRGPASALHSASTGGVVNVVSRTGRDSRGITVRAQGGAFGFRKYDARAGSLFAGGRWSGFTAVSYTSTNGYRAHSDADVLRGHVVLDYLAGPATRISIHGTGSRLDARLPGSLSQSEFDADPDDAAPTAATFGFGRGDHMYRAGARVETAAGNTVAGGYFFYGRGTLFLPIPLEIVDLDLSRVQGGGRIQSNIGHLPMEATVGFDYDRLFGRDYRWVNDAGVRGGLLDDGRYSVPGLSVYAQAEWHAVDAVTANLGLRYDHVTYGIESKMPGRVPRQAATVRRASPRLAVRWRPDAVTSVYASAGRGFEVPTLAEFVPRPGDPIRSVRPKSLRNYEVGARRTVGNRLLVEGSTFLAAVRGEFVPVTIDGVDLVENATRSRNSGVELGITALATRWLDMRASYTFLDLRLRTYTTFVIDSTGTRREVDFSGKRLPAVPKHRVAGEAQLRPTSHLSIDVQAEWQGKVFVETGNADQGVWYVQVQPAGAVLQVPFRAVPARTLAHVNAVYRLGAATLFGRVENVFGKRYAGHVRANDNFGRFYDAGAPRWGSLGLSVSGWRPEPPASP